MDDLFGTPEPADEGAAPAGDDDPFSSARTAPGGLASKEFKTWVDDTGAYSIEGRLVKITDEAAHILTAAGYTAIVPMGRLSVNDRDFVAMQFAPTTTQIASAQ